MPAVDSMMSADALAKAALAIGHGLLLFEGHRWRRGERLRRRILFVAGVTLAVGNAYFVWAYAGRPDLGHHVAQHIERGAGHARDLVRTVGDRVAEWSQPASPCPRTSQNANLWCRRM